MQYGLYFPTWIIFRLVPVNSRWCFLCIYCEADRIAFLFTFQFLMPKIIKLQCLQFSRAFCFCSNATRYAFSAKSHTSAKASEQCQFCYRSMQVLVTEINCDFDIFAASAFDSRLLSVEKKEIPLSFSTRSKNSHFRSDSNAFWSIFFRRTLLIGS